MDGRAFCQMEAVLEVNSKIPQQCIQKIYRDPRCSQFVHDVVSVIEKKMLLVLSSGVSRSSARDLLPRFQSFYNKCKEDPSGSYTTKGIPQEDAPFNEPPLVQIFLNTTARRKIANVWPTLSSITPGTPIQKSMDPEEFSKMD